MDLDEVSTTLGKRLSGMLVNETDSIEYAVGAGYHRFRR